jgi:hypothetical protein
VITGTAISSETVTWGGYYSDWPPSASSAAARPR